LSGSCRETEPALRGLSKEKPRRSLAGTDVEPVVDHALVEFDDLLDADGVMFRLPGAPEARLLRRQGQDAVTGQDHVGADLLARHDDALHPPVLEDQVLHGAFRDHRGAQLLHFLRKPAVEAGPEDARALRRPGQASPGVVALGDGAVPSQEADLLPDDPPFQGRFLQEFRKQRPDRVQVEPSAGQVLRPGIVPPLQDKHLRPLADKGMSGS
jgi:hypothetical protein